MTHTSSIIGNGYDTLAETAPELLKQVSLNEFLSPEGKWYFATYGNYAPGCKFNYSNLGSGIVGSLVEKISGERFDQYCINHIFKPLNIDASFDLADVKNFTKFGVIYRPTNDTGTYYKPAKDDNGTKPEHITITAPLGNALGWSPAGSVRISSKDLTKFVLTHMNGGAYNGVRILKSDTVDLMHQMQWYGYDPEKFYKQKVLNFQITDDFVQGRRLIGHAADAYGLIGDVFFDPEKKTGVILLFNGGVYGEGSPFYKADTTIGTALLITFAPQSNSKKTIKGDVEKTTLTVNDRKIILPVPATKKGNAVFVPEISTADILSLEISQIADKITFTCDEKELVLNAGSKDISVNNKKVTLIEAPYKDNNHIMVPLAEIAKYLDIRTDLAFKQPKK